MVDIRGHVVRTRLIDGWVHLQAADGRSVLFVEHRATDADIEDLMQLLGGGGLRPPS